MATKRLRSLILEVLPVDLRVKLDLLSRRRDISNREKQAELFNILREFKIDNVTKLGSGTNRYAFRLNGYVVKVATDNDGKIDNFKEFKMAKRLYPNVIKIYEVSSNGTLQICEYIQPFQSFSEMMMYADKIRNILQKLSSVYLIGDVGLSSRNYANWGLRVGSDEPVCLDFAYVYEVTSELFLCDHCKSGVLVPNKDFTELICPNPGCGHKFLFEDIRRKLGNDLHKQEIGDLTEEGYLLSESKVETTLDPQRSNYLEGKRKKKKKEIVEEVEEDEDFTDDFVYDDKEETTMKKNNIIEAIAQSMSEETFNVNGTTLKGVNVIDVTSAYDDDDVVVEDDDDDYEHDYDDYDDEDEDDYDDYAYDDDEEEDDDFVIPDAENNGLAFSGEVEVIDDGQIDISGEDTSDDEPEFVFELTDEEAGVEAEAEPEAEAVQEWDVVTNPSEDDWDVAKACQENFDKLKEESDKRVEAFRKEQEAKLAEAQAVAAKVEAMVTEVKEAVEAKPVEVEAESVEETKEEVAETAVNNTSNQQNISPLFVEQINRALSKFSNQIADFAYNDEVFDKIRNSLINKKFFAGDFKNLISSVLFRSLCIYLECKEEVMPNSNNKGTHKEYRLSKDDISNEAYYPTALFINTYWFNREMNNATNIEDLMRAYDKGTGLQEEFIDGVFRSRLQQKLAASTAAYDTICDYIRKLTVTPAEIEEEVDDSSDDLLEVIAGPADEAADELIETVTDTAEDVSLTVDEIVDTVMKDIEAEKEAEPEEVTTQEDEEAPIEEDVSIDEMVDAAFDSAPHYDEVVDDEDEEEADEEIDEMYDEDYDEDASSISVVVYHDEYGDVIKVKSEDEYGTNTIPIYTNLNTYKSIKDGMFNWLKNLVPFIVFKTSEPEKYDRFNDVTSEDGKTEDLVKFVPIGTSGNETIIGVYDFLGFYSVDDDGNMSAITDKTFIGKICAALDAKFPVASSYRERTLQMKDMWADESELLEYIRDQFNIDIDDDEEEDVVDTTSVEEEEEEHKVFTPIRRGDM